MIYFIISGVKKIVRFTEDFVIIDVRYIEVPLAGYITISGKEGAVQIINYRMMFSGNVFLIHKSNFHLIIETLFQSKLSEIICFPFCAMLSRFVTLQIIHQIFPLAFKKKIRKHSMLP